MNNTPTTVPAVSDCRCKYCHSLLARRDRDGLTIRRGDMQTTVTGSDVTVSVTCYRCKTLNVLVSRRPMPTPPTPASPALPRSSAA